MSLVRGLSNFFSKASKSSDMTGGKVLPTILAFAFPVMIGNLFQQLYGMVDAAVVGRGVGAEALAAVGVTTPVTQLLLGLMIGMTSGMSIVIAQHFGSGNKEKTRKAIASGIQLITAITLIVTILGIGLCKPIFQLINTPEELMDGAILYAVITFAGAASAAAYNYEASLLRAFGNSVIPLLFLVLTSILNVVLDLLFVFAIPWGIAGVAVATIFSQLISAVLCFVYMVKKVPEIKLSRSDWAWDSKMAKQHLSTGIPMAFFSSLLAISFLVLQAALNSLGSSEVAAYTAGSKMDSLVYQLLGAFGTAVSTFVAQNYGKGNMERVKNCVKSCLGITVGLSLFLTLFVFLFGKYFMQLFIDPSETAVLASANTYIRITSLMYFVLGINYVVRFALTGVGKSVIPMAVGISEIITRAAITYFLVYRIGFLGMAFASPACWVTSTALCVICYVPMMNSAIKAYKKRMNGT